MLAEPYTYTSRDQQHLAQCGPLAAILLMTTAASHGACRVRATIGSHARARWTADMPKQFLTDNVAFIAFWQLSSLGEVHRRSILVETHIMVNCVSCDPPTWTPLHVPQRSYQKALP